jgi:hypothetical protein
VYRLGPVRPLSRTFQPFGQRALPAHSRRSLRGEALDFEHEAATRAPAAARGASATAATPHPRRRRAGPCGRARATVRQVFGPEAVLQKDAGREISALARPADHVDLAIARQLIEAAAQLAERNVDRARMALHRELERFANVEDELPDGRVPVADRHVAAKAVRPPPRRRD